MVGAFAKGMSSSKSMNHWLRSCLPWLIVGDLHITNLWVDTRHNPADHPSRFKNIPSPAPANEDKLLDTATLKAVQKHRSPGTQALLEQEARVCGADKIFGPEADVATSVPSACSL